VKRLYLIELLKVEKLKEVDLGGGVTKSAVSSSDKSGLRDLERRARSTVLKTMSMLVGRMDRGGFERRLWALVEWTEADSNAGCVGSKQLLGAGGSCEPRTLNPVRKEHKTIAKVAEHDGRSVRNVEECFVYRNGYRFG
jgi:hypothetical protein